MSLVELCNLSLSRIGADTINSLDEPTREARLCNAHVLDVLEETQANFPWSFNYASQKLAPNTDPPLDPRFSYWYSFPFDFVRFSELLDSDKTVTHDYMIVAKGIVANVTPVTLLYHTISLDTGIFPRWYHSCVVDALSVRIVMGLTRDVKLLRILQEAADLSYRNAVEQERSSDNVIRPLGGESYSHKSILASRIV